MRQLVRFDAARVALAEARSVDEDFQRRVDTWFEAANQMVTA